MKNKDFLNICYKFLNRFIVCDKLIEQLNNMDKKSLSKKEVNSIDKIIDNIKEISSNHPNIEDEYVIKRKQKIEQLMERIKNIPKDENNEEFLSKELRNLENEYNKEIDSRERWIEVAQYITDNEYFNNCYDNLSKKELLEFITQYIKASYPPKLTNEEFEELVKIGIEDDKREALWRLAFNYEDSGKDFNPIVDYYIEKNDGYYLAELICAVSSNLDIDSIIEKLNDKDLIEDLIKRKENGQYELKDEEFKKLKAKLNNDERK